MDTVPQEILDRITSNLNISDTVRTCAAIPNTPLEDRVDPVVYLRRVFSNPKGLLSCMTDTGCIISGSRALEYFEPDSTTPGSDWDFFVCSDLMSVHIMMVALEMSGVKWDVDVGRFSRLLGGDVGHSEDIPLAEVRRAFKHVTRRHGYNCLSTTEGIQPGELGLITHAYDTSCELSMIRDEDGQTRGTEPITAVKITKTDHVTMWKSIADCYKVELVCEREQCTADMPSAYNMFDTGDVIIRGNTSEASGSQDVQLIVCDALGKGYLPGWETPMERVTSFYASHVQCFISGWCAVQLFPRYTSKKTSFIWADPEDPSVSKAISKYKARGYKFEAWTQPYTFPAERVSVENGRATFIDFSGMYCDGASPTSNVKDALSMLKAGLNMISWYVTPYATVAMSTDGELNKARSMLAKYDRPATDVCMRKEPHMDCDAIVAKARDMKMPSRMLRSGVLSVGSPNRAYPYML